MPALTVNMAEHISLSICIATRNRGQYIGETLDNILEQCGPNVEVVVVDGASTDSTASVVSARALVHSSLRYLPQAVNSGVDGDFDKAVELARGDYCWLMSDDDLMGAGAIARVLEICSRMPDALIIDAEVRTADLAERLIASRLGFTGERHYPGKDADRFVAECGRHLTFIGAVVIRRELWLGRQRVPYFGTEFIHVGVLFQAPLAGGVIALGEPLVKIRYGVGNWTSRSFQVWMFKWPALIWSFEWLSTASRAAITPREPWRSFPTLLLYRAKGWYSWQEFIQFIRPQAKSYWNALTPAIAALVPGRLLNFAFLAVARLHGQSHRGGVYDLERSPHFMGKR